MKPRLFLIVSCTALVMCQSQPDTVHTPSQESSDPHVSAPEVSSPLKQSADSSGSADSSARWWDTTALWEAVEELEDGRKLEVRIVLWPVEGVYDSCGKRDAGGKCLEDLSKVRYGNMRRFLQEADAVLEIDGGMEQYVTNETTLAKVPLTAEQIRRVREIAVTRGVYLWADFREQPEVREPEPLPR